VSVRSSVALAAVLAALGAGIVITTRRHLMLIQVVGESMAPVYAGGDRLLVRRTRRLRVGDVVIAHHQEGGRRDARSEALASAWLVKRLAALPGDPVPTSVLPVAGGHRNVPAGMAVLLGERPDSADSRSWGLVPLDDITGVVLRRLRSDR
jgi:signal peptidase I